MGINCSQISYINTYIKYKQYIICQSCVNTKMQEYDTIWYDKNLYTVKIRLYKYGNL